LIVPTTSIPPFVQEHYEIHEWRHAVAILASDFPDEWTDIIAVLTSFRLYTSDILIPGGQKSRVSAAIDGHLTRAGWREKGFDTRVLVDGAEHINLTHKIDCYKNQIGLEIEWNNKDPFYDRDLNNFRVLFDLRAISVGVIITRCDELQLLFNTLGRGSSYGESTTHMRKLLPRIQGGGAGGCPILIFGISSKLYVQGDRP